MNWYLLGAFIIASLVLLATPGPNLLAVIGRGIGQGHRAALIAVIGYALGDILNTACAILGLSALIRSSAAWFQIVKYVGAVYLIFLGVQAIYHKQHWITRQHHGDAKPVIILRQSIVASVLNPKTALFFLAYLPQFVDVSKGNAGLQMIVLGSLFMFLGIIMYCPIAYFAGNIGQWLQTKQTIADNLRWVTGSIFIMLGIRVALLKDGR
jgi:threonine/homoserine/homoserine lactone efflux protein